MIDSIPEPIDVMARTLWGEARSEGLAGMTAVANVIMNRVYKPRWWGKTVTGVCLKPYQFSCWLEGDPNLPKMKAVTKKDPLFAKACAVATSAINGELKDNTKGATSYYAKSMPQMPKWASGRIPCVEIGNHIFFYDE